MLVIAHMSQYQGIRDRNNYQLDCTDRCTVVSDPNFWSIYVPRLNLSDSLTIGPINTKKLMADILRCKFQWGSFL
jgi:hypothetical protein